MKKTFCAVCLFSLACIYQVTHAQVKKIIQPVNKKALEEFTKMPVTKPLSLTPLNRQQSDRVSLFNAYLLKALLYRYDPRAYPMTTDENSVDRMALKIVQNIPQKRLDKNKPRLEKLANSTDPKRQKILGRFKDIDLSRPSLSDVESIRTLDPEIFNIKPIFNLRKVFRPLQTPPDYAALDFILRAVHCVDETDPEAYGSDDIILAGVLYELNSTLVSSNGFYCGEFWKDDDYLEYGENVFASVPFANNNYPKYYYCMLGLIEQDTNESGEDLAQSIRSALSGINGKVCETPSPDCSLVAGEMASILESTIGVFYFFDDDLFPIYGVAVTINSKDEFGAGMQTGKLATAEISAHGGKYKIGYRWRLRK